MIAAPVRDSRPARRPLRDKPGSGGEPATFRGRVRHRVRDRPGAGGRSLPLGQPHGHAPGAASPRRAAAGGSLVAAPAGGVGRLEGRHPAADRAGRPGIRGGLPPAAVHSLFLLQNLPSVLQFWARSSKQLQMGGQCVTAVY